MMQTLSYPAGVHLLPTSRNFTLEKVIVPTKCPILCLDSVLISFKWLGGILNFQIKANDVLSSRRKTSSSVKKPSSPAKP